MLTHKILKLLPTALLGLFCGFLPSSSEIHAAGIDIDAEYRDPNEGGAGYQIVIFKDKPESSGFSYLMNGSTENLCASLGDAKCAGGKLLSYIAILPQCSSPSQLDCIVEFGTSDDNDVKALGTFIGTFPTVGRNQFVGDSAAKLPSGGAPTLWSMASRPHSGGTTYMVQVQSGGRERYGSFLLSDFNIEIQPVELITDVCIPNQGSDAECLENAGPGFYDSPTGVIGASRVSMTPFDCVVLAEDKCARRHALPPGIRFFVKVRLSQTPTGWFHGRISQPTVTLTLLSGTAVELTISATSVNIPVVAQAQPFSTLPPELQQAYQATGGFKGASPATRNRSTVTGTPDIRNAISQPVSSSATGMTELLMWLPHINDTATANIGTWAMRSLSAGETTGANSCFSTAGQLNGLVTTNATQYSAGPPVFDKAAGSLEYKVAAPHYTSGGNLFFGTYDLIMRSDVARCLYGFSKAPLNASISIIDNDGIATVATKLVSEKDGWLRISAYGFNFSNPTIKVILTPAVSEVTKTSKSKKTTITCKNGKSVKKITGFKPVCPKGFRKV